MDWPQAETKNLILTVLIKFPQTHRNELVSETIFLAEKNNLYQRSNGRTSPAPLDFVNNVDQIHILNTMDEVVEELKKSNYLVEDANSNLVLEENGTEYIKSILPQQYQNML